ncbi:OmpA family protein [Reichenbachiella agarivorans]|uniref:OmpA family protein n=1 Tax=Reichenbachiella agarivorans TaxID=2979464 RepID=A0ABY6CSV8_9BACT|nr:OmpA family protein [Reichenbachiella agarivorans]UXP33606.1 OmpA family protein [Reichenbachiella agarivorans]
MKTLFISCICLCMSIQVWAQCSEGMSEGDNLISNSDFCKGNQDFESDYQFTRESGGEALLLGGRYATVTNPQYAMGLYPACRDHSSNGGVMLVFNGSESPNENAWSQTVKELKTNTEYVFSFWTAPLLRYSPAELEVYIDEVSVGKGFKLDSSLCEWRKYTVTWNSGNNTQAKLAIRNINMECISAHFALDDISFSACVPSDLKHQLSQAKAGQVFQLKNIYFETAKYVLKPESYTELDVLLEFMWQKPNVEIEIAGHTDNVGSQTNNQILSENRAKAVADYLEEKGIKPYRFTARGYGEDMPVDKNNTEEGRQNNRRVEFKIVKI